MKTIRVLRKIPAWALALALALPAPLAVLAQTTDEPKTPAATGGHCEDINRKLKEIRFETVQYSGLPLGEIVKILKEESRKRDPDRKGVNFIINPNLTRVAPAALAGIDPSSGLPIAAAAPAEQIDIASVLVKIELPVNDIRLLDVLDLIVKVADHPITYTVEDYGVVFSPAEPNAAPAVETAFSFPGGKPRDFLKAVQEHFNVDWESVTDLPKEMEEVRIPRLRISSVPGADAGPAAEGGPLGALVSLYNQVGEQQPELGHLVVRGNLAKPSVVMFVAGKEADRMQNKFVVKAFSVYGLSDAAKAKLQEDIDRARVEAMEYTAQMHGPDGGHELDGTVALHKDTSLLVAAGQQPFVDMVESIVTACTAKERAGNSATSLAPTNNPQAR